MSPTAEAFPAHRVRGRTASRGVVVVLLVLLTSVFVLADELILDESLTEFQTIGDFDVSSCSSAVVMEQSGLFDAEGEMITGQLYAFFKQRGINSVHEIVLSLDVDPNASRTDYDLDSIEFSIEDLGSTKVQQKYTLGENSLHLPAYESSSSKPEAQIAIKLDYDFMAEFNEFSTQKIKFIAVNGNQEKVPLKVGVTPIYSPGFSTMRMVFLAAFAVFWVFVFILLFRATGNSATRTDARGKAASPA